METIKHICAGCIGEPVLRLIVEAASSADFSCDYCTDGLAATPISRVADRCGEVLKTFYEDSSQAMAVVVYDYTPDGEDFPSTIEKLALVSNDVAAEIVAALEDEWPADPWFVQRKEVDSPWMWEWSQMEISLRNEARFLNPHVADFMARIFGAIASDCTADGAPVLVDAGPGTKHRAFYRARVFQSDQEIEKALTHPEKCLGAPPGGVGSSGRMNAAGLPAFYGATLEKTALAEVRPPVGSKVIVARFDLVRPLKLLNLVLLAQVQLPSGASLFDTATLAAAQRRDFLRALSEQMTVPVMPGDQDRNYLVTQVVADYLAMHPAAAIDGILYPSVQVSKRKGDPNNMNVVLFHKAAFAIDSDSESATATAELWTSHGEEGEEFDPKILRKVPKPPYRYQVNGFQPAPALKLVPDSMVIHKVAAVEIKTKPKAVRLVKTSVVS